jgi:FeS assembly SUF system protein
MSEEAKPSVAELDALKDKVIEALRTVFDPEIPVNIWELGLVYKVEVSEDREVDIVMTLTSPACPVAGSLPGEVERKAAGVDGIEDARVELTWEPQWTTSMMSESARLELGFF